MDNKDLIVACVVGDGEAESGPTATCVISFISSLSHSNHFPAHGTDTNTSIQPNPEP